MRCDATDKKNEIKKHGGLMRTRRFREAGNETDKSKKYSVIIPPQTEKRMSCQRLKVDVAVKLKEVV